MSYKFATQMQIAKEVGLDKGTISRRIQRLEAMGVLKEGQAKEVLAKAKSLKEETSSNIFDDSDDNSVEVSLDGNYSTSDVLIFDDSSNNTIDVSQK